ncbi:MAG: SCO family protein [Hyphomicrobiaceae bacterium]|nr:SCO family protein [Hyphomicrobiaceae bacterium]
MSDRLKPPARRLPVAILAVLSAAVGLLALNEWFRRAALEEDRAPQTVTDGGSASRVGAPFSLLDTDGRRVTSGTFHGRKVLLLFADPRETDRLAPALQVATAAIFSLGGKATTLAPVLVSLDTSEGASRNLASVLAGLNPAWTGLHGTAEEINALARAFFVPLPESDTPTRRGAPPVGPPIAYLLDEMGGFLAHTPIPNDPDRLTEWLQRKL